MIVFVQLLLRIGITPQTQFATIISVNEGNSVDRLLTFGGCLQNSIVADKKNYQTIAPRQQQ